MRYCDKEILDALTSLQGAFLATGENDFNPKTYIGISIPVREVYKDLPDVFGISAASTLKDFLLHDLDERLCKHMGIPWPHPISMYGELDDQHTK